MRPRPLARIAALAAGLALAATGAVHAAHGRPAHPPPTPPAGPQVPDRKAIVDQLDRDIEAARQQWDVPGLAVAIVQNGDVLLAKGYGVRALDGSEPVDTDTLFAIGSTTKAMTASLLGQLVAQGKLGWDDHVIDHLPTFRVGDPYVTRELTPEFVNAYYGASVKEPVLVYEDLDIFPLWYSGISVWRRERLVVWDSSRSQFVAWPMRYTTDGQERTQDLNESIPAPPAGARDL